VKSAIYEGTIVHHRYQPIEHRFEYKIALPLVYAEERQELCRRHPLWSADRPNAVWLRAADSIGGGRVPVDQAVRDLMGHRLGIRPSGPVAVLTQPRTWGWLFNPVSIYFCFGADADRVEALVLEVTNTPWHERHCYVLPGPDGEHEFAKALHVSPFLSMDQTYRLSVRGPDEQLSVRLANYRDGQKMLDARLSLQRREISHRALGHVLWAYPLQTLAVSARIYRQALAIHRKGVPVHAHRSSPVGASTIAQPASPRAAAGSGTFSGTTASGPSGRPGKGPDGSWVPPNISPIISPSGPSGQPGTGPDGPGVPPNTSSNIWPGRSS
jgi:DUF1365 family protein